MNKQLFSPFTQALDIQLQNLSNEYRTSLDYIYQEESDGYIVRVNDSALWEEEEFQDKLTDIVWDLVEFSGSRPVVFVSATDKKATFEPARSFSSKAIEVSFEAFAYTLVYMNISEQKKMIFTQKTYDISATERFIPRSNNNLTPAAAV